MIKPILLFLVFLVIAVTINTPIWSQTRISGRIIDDKNVAITGANVYLENTYDGTSSNVNGEFSFTTSASGSVLLKVTFIGYKEYIVDITLTKEPLTFEIILKEDIKKMEAVVITAGTFEAGSKNKSEVLQPLDIVTTAGATADIAGALNTLPGTQTVGEEGRLFVRGGDGYETTTFIDGMVVMDSYNPSAPNIPTRGRFSPFMFSGTSFSTGGYSAEYGQGLSSALILNTKEVATETRSDISLISVGLEAAHTQVWKDASLTGKLGYFNLDPYYEVIKQDFDWLNPPTNLDGNLAFRQKVGKSGMFKSYGKFNAGDMTFNYEPFELPGQVVKTRMKNKYGHLNSSYRNILSDKWMVRTGVSYTYSNDNIKLNEDQVIERNKGLHLKALGGYEHNERLFIKVGGELISRSHFQEFTDFESGFEDRLKFSEHIISNFVEGDIYFSNSLVARIGERLEYNALNNKIAIDPRVSLALKTGQSSQISIAYGGFRQSAPQDLLRASPKLKSEKATHLILNFQMMNNNRTFRIEGYWKWYKDLVTFNPNLLSLPESYANDGDGYARGIDLFFRDGESIKNLDYWISYSYLATKRAYRDYPYSATPTFASAHNFSAVYKYFIPSLRTQLGLTYSFASGRPYNDPNHDLFNGQRTPSYHDLSANISVLPKPGIILHASITNMLKYENIFGYEYRSEPTRQGIYESRPIILPAPRFILLGVFITLTKSGSFNQLPNL